ncbi:MAG: hypothetical protein NTV04_00025 [Deltaproteobacteria bacterium]|nr:hypothetical protein [Deltaproteobacteria bacterium]
MKDLTKWTSDCEVRNLDEGRTRLEFCVDKLLADRRHKLTDEVVHGLTFEELLGGLAAGKAALEWATDSDDNGIVNRYELDRLPDGCACPRSGIGKDVFSPVASHPSDIDFSAVDARSWEH